MKTFAGNLLNIFNADVHKTKLQHQAYSWRDISCPIICKYSRYLPEVRVLLTEASIQISHNFRRTKLSIQIDEGIKIVNCSQSKGEVASLYSFKVNLLDVNCCII